MCLVCLVYEQAVLMQRGSGGGGLGLLVACFHWWGMNGGGRGNPLCLVFEQAVVVHPRHQAGGLGLLVGRGGVKGHHLWLVCEQAAVAQRPLSNGVG